jgi:hypothetical protein
MINPKCPVCDYEDNAYIGYYTVCPHCGTDLSEGSDEVKLITAPYGTGSFMLINTKKHMRMDASIYLTNKRLVARPVKMTGYGSGWITAAIYNFCSRKAADIVLPLTAIKNISDSRFGLMKALTLEIENGDSLKIQAPKMHKWKEALIKNTTSIQYRRSE